MSGESDFIDQLRALATHPGARGLADDAATLIHGGRTLVLTHDVIVENVHFLTDDPPTSIGWKLVAANLSDLAAKGAKPVGALMAYTLSGDPDWDRRFVQGLSNALTGFGCPLIGGDTVRTPTGSARHFGMTAIGEAEIVPARDGASVGDDLWVSGRWAMPALVSQSPKVNSRVRNRCLKLIAGLCQGLSWARGSHRWSPP